VLEAREIENRYSDLRVPDDSVGVLDHRGGWSEPDVYIPALTAKVREMGVDIREHDALTGFIVEGGRVRGVRARTSGEIHCDTVVCTVNAWANHVLAHVGQRLPFKNFIHERFVTFPFDRPPRLPATNDQSTGAYVRPTEDNRLLMGTGSNNPTEFEIPGPDFDFSGLRPDPESEKYLKAVMSERVPMWKDATFDDHRVGLISVAMDGQPVVGPVGDLPGLFLAINFHSGGFGHHPAAGFFLAEWIVDGRTSLDISEFSPDRFADDARDAFLAKQMTHYEAWEAEQSGVYKMRPIIRRH
jgi:sarcosine oxidase subunit beta